MYPALQQTTGEKCGLAGRPVGIALEQAKGALIHALMMYEFIVLYPINPKALARYRNALVVSGAKDDPSDARLLKDFFRKHQACLRPWTPEDAQTRTIDILAQHRRTAVEDRVRLGHRITALPEKLFSLRPWTGPVRSTRSRPAIFCCGGPHCPLCRRSDLRRCGSSITATGAAAGNGLKNELPRFVSHGP